MSKVKFLIKLCAIWGIILASFVLFALYQDFRDNKTFNYTDTYVPSKVEVRSERTSPTTFKYAFKLTTRDDYLGSVSFKYFKLKGNPGQVIFRIKETGQKNWYAENRYDFSYFNNDESYLFGFPEISDSKNKNYILEFEMVTPNLSDGSNFLDLTSVPILTTKYVFPRDMYYRSFGKIITIVLNRSQAVIKNLDKIKISLLSLAIATISSLVLYRGGENLGKKINNNHVADLKLVSSKVNPFFIPGAVLVILILAFVSGNFSLAERMSVYLWISLFFSAIYYIFQMIILNHLGKLGKFLSIFSINTVLFLDDLITKKTLLLFAIAYVVVSGFSSIYHLGGDDSRLFYIYPREFLINYSSKIVSDTGLSQLTNSIPPASLSAFMIIMIFLRNILPFFNLQTLLNSANLVGGVFAFYHLTNYLLKPQNKQGRVICLIASLMYVFSIFNFYTLLNSRLLAEYLISLFPLTLFLGIKGIREGKFYLMVAVVIIWSAFNFVSVTLPISAAALITSSPILIFATWKYKARLITYLIVSGLFFGALNLHWFVFIPYTNFSKSLPGSNTASITSFEFRRQNESGIRTVSEINSSFFPLLNSYHQKIQLNFNWPQLPIYLSWYSKLLISGYLLIIIIIAAGIVVEKDRPRIGIYITSIFGFLLAVYFFTVNISPWGISIFLWLTDHLPGFVIFRNMFDKFAYGLAFQWAFAMSVSLVVVIKYLKFIKYKSYLLFAVFLVVVLNAKPFVLGEFRNLPYWTTQHSYDGIKNFNKDYLDLINFVRNSPDIGRYLSLPLLSGNSVIIQDSVQKNHYYAGVSPLLLLTNKNDMSGLISFADNSKRVFHWLEQKDYEAFGLLLQKYNVRYVIVSNDTPSDLQSSFMFSDGLFNLQPKEFVQSLVGDKIKDFGFKYSLYKINSKYESNKLYLSDSPAIFANSGAELSFNKLASYDYDIEITGLKGQSSLIFLDPYLKEWQLLTQSGKQIPDNYHHVVFDYANLWEIDSQVIKQDFPKSDYKILPNGSMQLKLKLYFRPHDYFPIVNLISAGAYLLGILYVAKSIIFNKFKK